MNFALFLNIVKITLINFHNPLPQFRQRLFELLLKDFNRELYFQGAWVTALGAIINSDSFVSGGCDGFIRVWMMTEDRKRIQQLTAIEMVNLMT